ncbi:hypothetical protein IWQ60_009200 [Tieghemiomyces parasiticus]|uniref:DNA replication checkpoint mediator MRC1 domain-containing protein n=1 Tax=Tieghemiomyces parasiticus TaxID=78921 RepID=A0A9W7ZYH0_9FUNG|nr:hypothetical protein IWQ60_009200 [Tieghemiomyces parasiticus]
MSDDLMELEIVDDESTLVKHARQRAIASLLTGVNRYQTLLKSPDNALGTLSGEAKACAAAKARNLLSPAKKTPVGIDHRQLNAMLSQKILTSSAQTRFASARSLLAAKEEERPGLLGIDEDILKISDSRLGSEAGSDLEDEEEPADEAEDGEANVTSENSDREDTNLVEDDDDDEPVHRRRTVPAPTEAHRQLSNLSPPPSPKPAQALFPLFTRTACKPTPASENNSTNLADAKATAPISFDATLTLSTAAHARLIGGHVETPIVSSLGTGDQPVADDAIAHLAADTLDDINGTNDDKWFDPRSVAHMVSPSQDSFLDSQSPIDAGFPPLPSLDLTTTTTATQGGTPPLLPLTIPKGMTDSSIVPTQVLSPLDDTQPFTPTQALGEGQFPAISEVCTTAPGQRPTGSSDCTVPPDYTNRQEGETRLNRLVRRRDLVSDSETESPASVLPYRTGPSVPKGTKRPRSEFLDAEAEEGESDEEGGAGGLFGQARLTAFAGGLLGQPATGQPPSGLGGEAEEEEDDDLDLDEWDENDSMLAYSGDEADGDEVDADAVRQLHRERETKDDDHMVAALCRDLSEGKLAARSKQRRQRMFKSDGSGGGGSLSGLVGLQDWVDGDFDADLADRERRRLMWKRGLKLGLTSDRGEDSTFAKLSKLAQNPETAAFARSAYGLDTPCLAIPHAGEADADTQPSLGSPQADHPASVGDPVASDVEPLPSSSDAESDPDDHPLPPPLGRIGSSQSFPTKYHLHTQGGGQVPDKLDFVSLLDDDDDDSLDLAAMITRRVAPDRAFGPTGDGAGAQWTGTSSRLTTTATTSLSEMSGSHTSITSSSYSSATTMTSTGASVANFQFRSETRLKRFLPNPNDSAFSSANAQVDAHVGSTVRKATAGRGLGFGGIFGNADGNASVSTSVSSTGRDSGGSSGCKMMAGPMEKRRRMAEEQRAGGAGPSASPGPAMQQTPAPTSTDVEDRQSSSRLLRIVK